MSFQRFELAEDCGPAVASAAQLDQSQGKVPHATHFKRRVTMGVLLGVAGLSLTALGQSDVTPPTLVSAVRQPNLRNIIVTFSECMDSNALDRSKYLLCTDASLSDCLTLFGTDPEDPSGNTFRFVPGSGRTQVLLGSQVPTNASQPYVLAVTSVSDFNLPVRR